MKPTGVEHSTPVFLRSGIRRNEEKPKACRLRWHLLGRLLDANTRSALSPSRFPRLPLVTMIATERDTPLTSERRNIVRSGKPA
jgi:hypothetical protein